jgi:homoserine kinase
MANSIKVYATGSVANVSCGFDCLGYSIENPGDEIEIYQNNSGKIEISMSGIQAEKISTIPENNTAGKAIISMLSELNKDVGFTVHIKKGIPPGSGIGSSASSAVGAIFGVNQLLGNPLNPNELIIHAMAGEAVASGGFHADNVAPSLFGGMVLIRNYEPLDIIQIPIPGKLWSTVILPEYVVNTRDARDMLPNSVSLKLAVEQAGNLAGFTLGFANSDYDLISRSMEDLFAEPVRKELIPGFKRVKSSALENGAIGCGISGSGPSMFAFSIDKESAMKIAEGMQDSFKKSGLNSKTYVSKINQNPPQILD